MGKKNVEGNGGKAEKELERIQRFLTKSTEPEAARESYEPPYGNLVKLNTARTILGSVGEEVLSEIASDYLSLIEMSGAIYEKNGDYALGIFSSGWCRFLDLASRKLCGTDDNREALDCGKWLCHESCWTEASKAAIEKGEPVDIECNGGIRLHAVPIRAAGEVVGAINFGYGDPPREPGKLKELAEKFRVSTDELQELAEAYESRPAAIIEVAKDRLRTSAKLIGAMVESKRREDALRRSERELSLRNRINEIFGTVTDEEMYLETLNVLLEAAHSKYGVFGYIDENGAYVVPTMTRHIWDKCQVPDKQFVFPRDQWGHSIWPRAIREKKLLYSNEPSTLTPEGHVPITRNITAPIIHRGEVIGLFQVANKEADYDEEDVHIMQMIADTIAPVLNARLQRERQERARDRAEQVVTRQAHEILEIATPVMQIWEGVVVAPLIGVLDSQRTQQFTDKLLESIVETNSAVALIDITGVPTVDTQTGQHLVETISAVRLLGAEVVLTGVRPAIAQTLVHLGVDLSNVTTRASLAAGLRVALDALHLHVTQQPGSEVT